MSMNNDLEQFSEERLMQMERALSIGSLDDRPTMDEMLKIIRIALAAKQAKPVVNAEFKDGWPVLDMMGVIKGSEKLSDGFHDLYTTPQPAHTERDGWIKCSDRMPEVGDVVITAYQGATNIGEMERSGRDYRYFTSIASGRELPADFWMPLPAAPKPESE